MAKGMSIEDMPIFGHVKGIDRVFEYGNLKDDRDLRKILSERPSIVWIDEPELKEA